MGKANFTDEFKLDAIKQITGVVTLTGLQLPA